MKDKKERMKRLSMAAFSFCLMLAIAGYINYKYNPEREKDLGQTVYVSTNNDEVNIYKESKDVFSNTEDNITSFRNDRDNMYSELSNNYSSIINNSNSSPDVIAEYQGKLSQLVEEKNQIAMVENIIKSKGIEEVVVIKNMSGKINVILKSESVDDALAAQVMQIVVEQLGVGASDISIENISMWGTCEIYHKMVYFFFSNIVKIKK